MFKKSEILLVIDNVGCKLRCAAVGKGRNNDSRLRTAGMDHLAVANVHGHMAGIEDQIAGLSLAYTDSLSEGSLSACPGDLITEMLVDPHGEAGAVRSIRQGCSAVYIGISQELLCIRYHFRTKITVLFCAGV